MKNNETVSTSSYLSFKLGNEEFAVHTSKVLSILEMCDVISVPKAPVYMKGIINLRGAVLPVLDLKVKLGMSSTQNSVNTCIVVFDIFIDNELTQIGAFVDSVQAVLEISSTQIMPAPSIGSKYNSNFIEGVVNVEGSFVMLLNMDSVFSNEKELAENFVKDVA
jgi:purine-binding chemotaxis protein CheW